MGEKTRTAEDLAGKMREISIAEFFEKNRHLLGFDNPAKALLTVIKEAVDNSLTYDMPIVVKENNRTRIARIGEMIDKEMDDNRDEVEMLRNGDLERLRIKDKVSVVSFDKDGRLDFRGVSTLYRHRVNSDIFRVRLESGRCIDLTAYHSVFTLRKGEVATIKTSDIKKGEYLIVPKNHWGGGQVKEINLLEEMLQLDAEATRRINLYGVSHIFTADVIRELKAILPKKKFYKIQDFKKCSYLPLNILRELHIDTSLFSGSKLGVSLCKYKIPVILKADSYLAELLGLYTAEGSTLKSLHRVCFSFGSHETELARYTEEIFERVFGFKPRIVKAHKTAINVRADCYILGFVLKKIFMVGDNAKSKRIPEFVFDMKFKERCSFLMGYLSGDGYPSMELFELLRRGLFIDSLSKEKMTLATSSYELFYGLQYLLSSLGVSYSSGEKAEQKRNIKNIKTRFSRSYYIYVYSKRTRSSINKMPIGESLREVYDSKLKYAIKTGRHSAIYSQTIGKLSLKQAVPYDSLKSFLSSDLGLLKVVSIEKIDYDKEWVYDVSVPECENFIGGVGAILCHNTLDACEDARILPTVRIVIREPREVYRIADMEGVGHGQVVIEGGKVELTFDDNKIKFLEKKEPGKNEMVYLFEDKEKNTYKLKAYFKDDKTVCEFYRGRTEFKASKNPADRFIIAVEDNGPGIIREAIPRVFGKLLFGSKFAGGRQGRGQQGIGISAALLYAQLTTGKPARVWSRTAENKPVHYFELRIDTTKNEPVILEEKNLKEIPHFNGKAPVMKEHGTRVELEIEGKYSGGVHSVDEYVKETAAVNPFANIYYESPLGNFEYMRAVNELPPQAKPIKPHPHGVEMGMLERMLKLTSARTLEGFLSSDFCRVSVQTADEVRKLSGLKPGLKPQEVDHEKIEKLWRTIQSYQFMKPPMDCLSPIGEEKFMEGIKKEYQPDFIAAVTRPTAVYRGNPFQIECVIAHGGKLQQQGPAKVLRFANRVPLLYQASSCATTKSILKVDWRSYSIDQQGSTPHGPVLIALHMASVWIPYISEAKEAIDPYPIIVKEMRLALQEAGRRLQRFIAGKHRREESAQRMSLFEKYIPEAADVLHRLTDKPKAQIEKDLEKILKKGDIIKQIQEGDAQEPKEEKPKETETEKEE